MNTDIYAKSNRITLTHLCPSNIPQINRYLSDFETSKWLSTVPHPLPADFAHLYVAKQTDQPDIDKSFAFAIIENASAQFIGIASFRRREDSKLGIGYWLGSDYRNRGYATEAVRLMIDYLYDIGNDDIELVSQHSTNNQASANVLQKVGFRYTGECVWSECLAIGDKVERRMMKLDRIDYLKAKENAEKEVAIDHKC